MNGKLKKYLLKFLDIFLTALVSALIAIAQQWLSSKTGSTGVEISPSETAGIGGVLATVKNSGLFKKIIC